MKGTLYKAGIILIPTPKMAQNKTTDQYFSDIDIQRSSIKFDQIQTKDVHIKKYFTTW